MTDGSWIPTRFGGLRRATEGSSDAQSGVLIRRASETRSLPLGLKFERRRVLGLPECPYVIRWMIGHDKIGSLRLHHWLGPDDDRAPHDHPWWFITCVLKGGYLDVGGSAYTPEVTDSEFMWPFRPRFRHAIHQHTVVPIKDTWSLVLTGPTARRWGFWSGGKFIKANKWFASRGHHVCSS